MEAYRILDLDLNINHVIAFVGAGGKSTSMDVLAKELKEIGKKVLVTTTTVIFQNQHKDNDVFILGELPQSYIPMDSSITVLGKSMDNEKIRGITPQQIEEIYKRKIFDIILIEADGARMKPIKAPASHEPVVPSFCTMTIGVIGLDSIGNPIDENNVHRPEILSSILEVELPHNIDSDDIVKLVIHEEGIFKGSCGRRVLFLNKAYKEELVLLGTEIRRSLYKRGFKDVYITEIGRSKFY